MLLRNKKTGEILHIGNIIVENPKRIDCGKLIKCSSLAELNEVWEDYEEPKEYWYVYGDDVMHDKDKNDFCANSMKAIGNYFETKEEAEKAVEKLKAWKRLKDKGFRFKGLCESVHELPAIEYDIDVDVSRDSQEDEDLDLLFSEGGEE